MISESGKKDFLKWLFEKYTEKYGYGVRNLEKQVFYVTYPCSDTPEKFLKRSGGRVKSLISEYANELEKEGLVKFGNSKLEFHLTETGYDLASKSGLENFFIFLNKNPGFLSLIAIVISMFALGLQFFDSK